MNTVKNNVALLVHSCDRYAFLFKGFEFFFNRHWNFNIPCNYYFATEEKHVQVKGFVNIQSGKGEWTNRLAYLLSEKITEDYVLYLQEDVWLKADVNSNFFKELFRIVDYQGWLQVKLHSSEVYNTIPTGITIEGFTVAKLNNVTSDYLMSHQVTLWRREYLLAQMVKGEHPWRNERKGTQRLKKLNPDIYQVDYFSENDKPAINDNPRPVGRSGYNSVSVNGMLNINVNPFIKEIAKGNEEEREYAAQLLHHYTKRLTHDGKQPPRKDGFFKKMKKWVRGGKNN